MGCFKTIVLTETDKPLCQFPPSALDVLYDNRRSIVEPDFLGNPADMAEDGIQRFQQAFHVFSIKELVEALVAAGK